MGRQRRSADERARVAIEALEADGPIREIAEKCGVHPNQISTWKRQLLESAGEVFRAGGGSREKELQMREEQLLCELSQQQIEKVFPKKH